jgi:hypothetical protein
MTEHNAKLDETTFIAQYHRLIYIVGYNIVPAQAYQWSGRFRIGSYYFIIFLIR